MIIYVKNKIVSYRGELEMKKKILLSIIFIFSLIPMCFSQYGVLKGVQEVSGLINLTNPIGFIAVILYTVGIWTNSKNENINKYFPYFGMGGVILSELKNFLTWNYPNTSYLECIKNCFNMVFPMFYVGLIISILLILVYRFIDKKI